VELEQLQVPVRGFTTPDGCAIAATAREVLLDLARQLDSDPDRAREALKQVLGSVRIEQDGDAVYANVTARLDRVLLAVGGPSLVEVAGTGLKPAKARSRSSPARLPNTAAHDAACLYIRGTLARRDSAACGS
jgi:hypothetical protein